LRLVAEIEWKKTTIHFFSTFGSEIKEFEQNLKQTKKIPKT
jgi:hypothetical protein